MTMLATESQRSEANKAQHLLVHKDLIYTPNALNILLKPSLSVSSS